MSKNSYSDELKESLEFTKADLTPIEVANFSKWVLVLGMILSFCSLIALKWLGFLSFSISILVVCIPIFLSYISVKYFKDQAKFAKSEAIGECPMLLIQLSILLKRNPNLEKALFFISKFSSGRIVQELREVFWDSFTGHKINLKKSLISLIENWKGALSDVKRGIVLIVNASGEKNEIKRNLSLERAVKVSIDGIINNINVYAGNLYFPTLFLFSFGTILPLVIISVLPILSFMGNEFSSPLTIVSILALSLGVVYLFSNRVIMGRPPAFANIKIPEFIEGSPRQGNLKLTKGMEVNTLFYITALFLFLALPGIFFYFNSWNITEGLPAFLNLIFSKVNTLSFVWAIGICIIIYCYGSSWYKKKARDEVEALDREIADGAYNMAVRLDEGKAPEMVMKEVGLMSSSSFGKIMNKSYELLRGNEAGIESTFFDETKGSLKNIYSERFRIFIRLFLDSIKGGIRSCSESLMLISDYFNRLRDAEEKMNNILKNSVSMMKITATIFAPMISGLVVTLQQLLQDGIAKSAAGLEFAEKELWGISFLNNPGLGVESLQLISGVYMLILSLLLIRYSVMLECGKDEVQVKSEIARNTPIALFIFTFTLIFSKNMMF